MMLYSGASVGAAERQWAESEQQPTYVLMQRAAQAAVRHIAARFDAAIPVTVLAGTGNNGGDGFLVALQLWQLGWSVDLWLAGEPRAGSDAEKAWAEVQAGGVPLISDLPQNGNSRQYVDALLGTGFQGTPRGEIARAIAWLQHHAAERIVSLDCPSGLDATTGAANQAVMAGSTITFIAAKFGLFTGQGPSLTGNVELATLDVSVPAAEALAEAAEPIHLQWPYRPPGTHKGEQGHTLVMGGAPGMVGAGIMAAESALISGSGLVTAAIDDSGFGSLMVRAPEIMTTTEMVPATLSARHILAIGPGFGRDGMSAQRWRELCGQHFAGDQPWLVDADALWHLAQTPGKRDHWVLTPHPGEAARLLGCSVKEVEVDRLASAYRLQRRYGGVVVLKGAGTLVVSEQRSWVIPLAVGAMATGGMGDVLSGVIAALMAQRLSPEAAAVTGTYLLVAAASSLAHGQSVVRATDVLKVLPQKMCALGFLSQEQRLPYLQSIERQSPSSS